MIKITLELEDAVAAGYAAYNRCEIDDLKPLLEAAALAGAESSDLDVHIKAYVEAREAAKSEKNEVAEVSPAILAK